MAAIQLYYDSLSQAAAAFGCSRQWLSKLIEKGDLIAYDIPGQPQAKRVWHQHVAEALAKNGGLRPHSCVCYDTAHLLGIEEGRQESDPQLAQVQRELAEAREELAKVKAQLVEVEQALTEAAQVRPDPDDEAFLQAFLEPGPRGWRVHAEIDMRIHRAGDPETAPYRGWRHSWFEGLPPGERRRLRFGDRTP